MWLLYLYRMARNGLMAAVCVTSVLAAIPDARTHMLKVSGAIAVLFIGMTLCRVLGGAFFRRIDRVGVRWGFPNTNAHDH